MSRNPMSIDPTEVTWTWCTMHQFKWTCPVCGEPCSETYYGPTDCDRVTKGIAKDARCVECRPKPKGRR